MKSTLQHPELNALVERLCEDHLSDSDVIRLEELVISDRSARRYYLDYMQLHGTLHWDAAGGLSSTPTPIATAPVKPHTSRQSHRLIIAMASVATLLVVGFLLQQHYSASSTPPTDIVLNPDPSTGDLSLVVESPETKEKQILQTLPKNPPRLTSQDHAPSPKEKVVTTPKPHSSVIALPVIAQRPESSNLKNVPQTVVAYINNRIELGWHEGEITPSPQATDEEWVRRIHLDITGQIPSATAVDHFVRDKSPDKRTVMINNLLESPAYVSHFTTVWTNLLIGRDDSRDVDRPSLELYLSSSFAKNRPWNEIASDLISAEGDAKENGAANFLLAHLNNQAVPATAITARLFLGTQVQCTQCHDHPFNDWKQDQFWELNCFFKQTKKVRTRNNKQAKLVTKQMGGPTFYENRRGVMRAAYPKYSGEKVSSAPEVNRRKELSRLIATGEKPLLAKAMVNRMWAHFMGFGFTHPIDDMGPHNPPTHPQLLDQLTIQFVESGYDLKQIVRWICHSRAYQLTSRYNDDNQTDDPEAGHSPLFSRMYVKAMSAEQLFDSLVVTTSSHQKQNRLYRSSLGQRQQWLQQFVFAFETEENDELMDFNGTVPQALMMMNGTLMDRALETKPGSLLHHITSHFRSDRERIRQLYLVALSRFPSSKELSVVQKMLRQQRKATTRKQLRRNQQSLAQEYQNILWALLNSNEFLLVH